MAAAVILFDLGKVIFDYDFDKAYKGYIKKVAKKVDIVGMDSLFNLELLDQYERGNIETKDFFAQFSKAVGYSGTINEFTLLWNDIFTPIEPILFLIPQLAKKNRLAMLTNICDLHFTYLTERYPQVFLLFEKVFASYQMHKRKPDPAIYQEVIDALAVDPSKIFFTDDKPENIEAAKKCGINAHQFTNPKNLIKQLNDEGIIC
ncbi:MAG: HAD family phosphatase [Elusimicrobiota bacterium]|jgi:putative hydrolase of the HAD superfamily|nr:HAD family phosphatase [Elusimicrobiota bacterium]